jgi:uncharacterized protein (DUF305 family)
VRVAAVCAVLPLLLVGCSGDDEPELTGETAPNIVQPGAPGEPTRTLTPEELEDLPQTPHTEADVRFMQGMIHHHAQALHMTSLVPSRSSRRDIELLAKRIDVSQEGEITLMRTWLEDRDEEAPALHRAHGHAHGTGNVLMPGMLTQAEMRQLEAARAGAFDRLFLRSMIRHHEGAVTMVEELFASGSGAEAEVGTFARHVDADQQVEIVRMREMLNRLAAAPAR